jgi:hypothetical protein
MSAGTSVWLVKGLDGYLLPGDHDSEQHFKKFKVGDVFEAKVVRKRNGLHHRLGMAILRLVFDSQERYTVFEQFMIEVKILTGYVDTHISTDGVMYKIPRSIAFDRMDELAFAQWKEDAITVLFEHFIPGMPRSEQDRVIRNLLARM